MRRRSPPGPHREPRDVEGADGGVESLRLARRDGRRWCLSDIAVPPHAGTTDEAVGRPNPCCTCGAGTAWAASLVRAGLASHPPVASATGQSRPGGAPQPCRRPGAAANVATTAIHRNTAGDVLDAAWSRRCWPPRRRAGWTTGWVGRAAPVLGGGPAVTGGGAGRPGPAGPGGSRGLGRRVDAAAGRDGRAGETWSAPPSTSRWIASSVTFSTFTAGCHRGPHPGPGRVHRRHPDRVIPRRQPPPAALHPR